MKSLFRSRYVALFYGMGLYLLSSLGLRIYLYTTAGLHHVSAPVLFTTFLTGTGMDLAGAILLFLPLAVLLTALSEKIYASKLARFSLAPFLVLLGAALFFLLKTEAAFFDEFNARFNTVAVDYLIYPQEVAVSIWESYPVVWVVGSCLLGGLVVAFLARSWIKKSWDNPLPLKRRAALLGMYFVLSIGAGLCVKIGHVRNDNDRVIGEISSNGALSFLYALGAATWITRLITKRFRKKKRTPELGLWSASRE